MAKFGLGLVAAAPHKLDRAEVRVVEGIPLHIRTAISKLQINPVVKTVNCCPKCFATYNTTKTPLTCIYARYQSDEEDCEVTPSKAVCGERLLKMSKDGEVSKPVCQYAYQSLADWICRLLSRPGIEAMLDSSLAESRRPFDCEARIQDIHASSAWKSFKWEDDTQFTAES